MKKLVIAGILLMLLIGSFVVVAVKPVHADPVMRIDEFQMTTDPADQSEPEIDGGRIVWQDNRNGNWDIYMLSDAPPLSLETQITTNTSNQQYPVIHGDRIVYADDRNGNWDIYLAELSYSNPDAPPAPGTPGAGSAPDAGEPSTGFVTLNTTFVDFPALKFADFPAPKFNLWPV